MTMENSQTPDEVETRLEALLLLSQEYLDEFKVQLRGLLEENISLKQKLESKDLFEIDTVPDHDVSDRENSDARIYDCQISVLSKNGDENIEVEKKSENVVQNTCFNCSGNHQLPDCKEPRDFRRINQNRKEFLANNVKSARYHIDDNQKFGQHQPGLPSAALRKALGLDDDQLPSYIYRMRVLGTPPGWLKAAEIKHSGLGIYVDKDLKAPDANEEEGEISEEIDKVQYDFDRLPEWPGFNVDLPEKFRDESRRYDVPPLRLEQSKKFLMEELKSKAQRGYIRGKMQQLTPSNNDIIEVDEDGPSSAKKIRKDDKQLQNGNTTVEPEVVSVDSGTPIVTLYSPFASLPSREKWTTNTTDHIFFENLPESTGKYENIRGILQKIRKTTSQPNFDEDDSEQGQQ